MSTQLELSPQPRIENSERFLGFLDRTNLSELADVITPKTPLAGWSMEVYDQEDLGIKGAGGLGVLEADIRRVAEDIHLPFVLITPFYPKEVHQALNGFRQEDVRKEIEIDDRYENLGPVVIKTDMHPDGALLQTYKLELGTTTALVMLGPNFGEVHDGESDSDHRLYQLAVEGIGGFQALRKLDIDPSFHQLNEAPTVFAAIAHLDELREQGVPFADALQQIRAKMLYTNHTLVQAVKGEFSRQQFENIIMRNIKDNEVKDWIWSMFGEDGSVKLSTMAIEIAGARSGVSKLHAEVADFRDRQGSKVKFVPVTNGISDKWILPEIIEHHKDLGILDEYGLPPDDPEELAARLDQLDVVTMRRHKRRGREVMNAILVSREDQYRNGVYIPDGEIVGHFNRRIAEYKRPGLAFTDPDRFAEILQFYKSHFLIAGKAHPNDTPMKDELERILYVVDGHPGLRERVHFTTDYDGAIGRAYAFGGDYSINNPKVGFEACGTSLFKNIRNYGILISTPDGGAADVNPIGCLEIKGDDEPQEVESLYSQIVTAAEVVRDDERWRSANIRQYQDYLAITSGPRMMRDYLRLYGDGHRASGRLALAAVTA